jgi:NADP-dependent 3-hydroxy acid dehydrogenase YdfG
MEKRMLVDETVMITGASSGIGAACARAFAAAGRLILCARREARLRDLAEQLDAETHVMTFDVRDRASVQANIALLGPAWSKVDVLVNNAGLAAGFGPVLEGDPHDWGRMIDTNVRGLLEVTRAIVPHMASRGRGHVINIGSIAGRETYPNGVVYCASKAAVDRITRGLRMELNGTGVRVSTVDPGAVETEFSVVRFHGDDQRADDVYRGMTPLTGDDVAETVVWVADRPAHVQIAEVVIFPTDQGAATMFARD